MFPLKRDTRPTLLTRLVLIAMLIPILVSAPAALAKDAWIFADSHPAFNPHPWMCSADPGAQLVKHEYQNWHCTNPTASTPVWGLEFISFHRQLILDYDLWRLQLGGDRVEIWDFGPGAIIPGDNETTNTAFTHCPEYPGSFRPAGAICTGCMPLPVSLNVLNIGDFASLGHAGAELVDSGWLSSFFNNAGAPGGSCNELSSMATATRDPIFYMGLKKVNDVALTWQRLKAADIVVVLDCSSSMFINCSIGICDGPPNPDEAGCRLNAAKNAALMLADLIDDTVGPGGGHRIGLVSFDEEARIELPLTNVAGIVTDNDITDTPYEIAIADLEPCGWTAIGDGLIKAMQVLAAGSNPHQAILLLTDGLENQVPFIADVEGLLGAIQLCAVGIGEGCNETSLRNAVENHGGIFVAQEGIDTSMLTLEKFFVDCFGQIFDEVVNQDPELVFPGDEVVSLPVKVEVLPQDGKVMLVSGFRPPDGQPPSQACRLRWIISTPSGELVDMEDSQVEVGTGPQWGFVRIRLPYQGEHEGTWQARLIRDQRVFLHGFPTDAYVDLAQGIALVREEIHRLVPLGAENVLYFEDGSITSSSAYADALALEVAAGTILNLTQATGADDFATLLAQEWDLVVFARQADPTAQSFDEALVDRLCQDTKALITDLYVPATSPNPLYMCLGINAQSSTYMMLAGNGRLVDEDVLLHQLTYPASYLSLFPVAPPEPLLAQGSNEMGLPIIVGSGSDCGEQHYFYTSHTAGVGRVEPANLRPRVLVGQSILAAFQITELNRPPGGWDQVSASVELWRPGSAVPTIHTLYDDGTHGDKVIGNHTWSNLIPYVTTTTGAHKLRAIFDLTLGGQTVTREAEYSVIVVPVPELSDCTELLCYEEVDIAPGWQLPLGPCLGNMCIEDDIYNILAIADKDWLCVENQAGELVPVGTQHEFSTPPIAGGEPTCLDEEGPLFLCVPEDAGETEQVTVRFLVSSQNYPSLPPHECTTVYQVVLPDPNAVDPSPRHMSLTLHAARPNPFNPRTEIRFSVPGLAGETHRVQLRVFDVHGHEIRVLVDEMRAAGSHSVFWDGRDAAHERVPSGVYLYRLDAAGQMATAKLLLLK